MKWYGTVNSILLHYYLIILFWIIMYKDPEQFLINDNFTVASINKSTLKEWNDTKLFKMIPVPVLVPLNDIQR